MAEPQRKRQRIKNDQRPQTSTMLPLPYAPEHPLAKPRDTTFFPWAKLPGEIKNIIYRHFFHDAHPISLRAYEDPTNNNAPTIHRNAYKDFADTVLPAERTTRFADATALLLVDRQTNAEAGSVLYRNRFVLANARALDVFLRALRPATRAWLRSLTLEFCCDSGGDVAPAAFRALVPATRAGNMRTLRVERLPHTWGPEPYAEAFHRMAGPWLEEVVRGLEEEGKKREALAEVVDLSDEVVQFMDAELRYASKRILDRKKGEVVGRFLDALVALLEGDSELEMK